MKPVYLAAALALVAVVETATALVAPLRVASPVDWDAAAAEVRANYREGDLIVFAPYWADQTGRAHLGDLVSVEMAGHADTDRYSRIWELSIRGARSPEVSGNRVKETRHGKVTVSLYEKPSQPVIYDFTSHSEEARVTVADRAGEQPCLRDVPGGFRCPGSRVEKRTLEIDYRPRRGILIPLETARDTHVAFDEVPLGTKLVGYTGMHDYFARKNGDGPVDLKIFVDGREKLSVRTRNQDGWKRFEVSTEPGTHAVRFEISSPQPGWRNLGLHVEAR